MIEIIADLDSTLVCFCHECSREWRPDTLPWDEAFTFEHLQASIDQHRKDHHQ